MILPGSATTSFIPCSIDLVSGQKDGFFLSLFSTFLSSLSCYSLSLSLFSLLSFFLSSLSLSFSLLSLSLFLSFSLSLFLFQKLKVTTDKLQSVSLASVWDALLDGLVEILSEPSQLRSIGKLHSLVYHYCASRTVSYFLFFCSFLV